MLIYPKLFLISNAMFAWYIDKLLFFCRVAILVLLDGFLLLIKAYIKFSTWVYIILTLITLIWFNVLDKLYLILECIAQIFLEVSNIHTLWYLGVFISLSFIVLTYYYKLWVKYPRLYLVGNIISFIFIAFSLWYNKDIIFNIIQIFESYIFKILGEDKDKGKPKDNNTPGDPDNNGNPNPGGNDKPPLNKSPEKKRKKKRKDTIEETNRKRREAEKRRKDNRDPNEKTPYKKGRERDIERKKRERGIWRILWRNGSRITFEKSTKE